MIHIFTALYPEAKPLIQELKLKKRMEQTHYQQFVSETQDLTLTLTGTGPMNAAMVVSSVLTEYGAGVGDQLLSLGTAAELSRDNGDESECAMSMYHIHRITDKESGRSFYPDMLLHTGLPEASVVTGTELLTVEGKKRWAAQTTKQASSLNGSIAEEDENAASRMLASGCTQGAFMSRVADEMLYDMEAAGVYQAASMFLGPHQMNFLRIVTDQGLTAIEAADPKVLSAHVTECVASHVEKLLEIVDKLRAVSDVKDVQAREAREKAERVVENGTERAASEQCDRQKDHGGTSLQGMLTASEQAMVDQLILDAHFSKAMADECRQLLRYAKLTQLDGQGAVEAFYHEGRVPTRDKRAGKKILEELKRTLLCF